MRNLKNFNHWIAEIRDLAVKNEVETYDEITQESHLMTKSDINWIFNKEAYEEDFKEGLSPSEAFENTIEAWRDGL